MLSASALAISNGVRSVAAMLSPEKNPCRVKGEGAMSNWYRFDPYVSRCIPSPLKTQVVSPLKSQSSNNNVPAPQDTTEQGLHRNSLFAAPAAEKKERTITAPEPIAEQPEAPVTVSKKSKSSESAKTHYAIVYFKHDSATFIAPFRVKEGDHVIVEGDRGCDLGVIGEITTETPRYRVPLKIVRRATSKDMEAFHQKQTKEQVVVQQVQTLSNNYNLGIRIVDAEFQFDNNKLTVFFATASNEHIDFRKLQRSLFRDHRCRIWLSNMAEIEYNAKVQQTRRTR